MFVQILISLVLAVVQAATEFLPISSDGHLTLFSHLIAKPNLAFFVFLNLASMLAVVIFVRKEIKSLFELRKEKRNYWIFLLIGIIPTGLA